MAWIVCLFGKLMHTFKMFESTGLKKKPVDLMRKYLNEPVHEISNNVVCATSKASDQPAHTHSLIRAFASPLGIL